ncbi:cytochrome P450 [Ophiobolus disseminans]|uniref:Cytochrome P450 n=1 Tax=Ophiobolus disseminans TaxID=1469910 RepID=A0A6A7A6J5_9PLEO|nr:cytochrome P450 [Ophiobolus disseminans]
MDFIGPHRVLSTPTSIVISGTLFLAAFLFYRWLLPKPIAGIFYNEEATKSIFGDIPSMLAHLKQSQALVDWLLQHNTRHQSPIVQVFADLFGKPMVVISDYREIQDIVMRRTKEFDKPDMISDMFYGINEDHHTVKVSNDEFRYQRKLMQDLMAPQFLHNIAVPQLHSNFKDLVDMWSEKMRLSEGRPFSVKHDIYITGLEAIWGAVFGNQGSETVTRKQIDVLSRQKNVQIPSSTDDAVEFAEVAAPPAFDAVLKLTDSLEHVGKSPFPRTLGFAMRYFPSISKHVKVKDRAVSEEIAKAEKRMAENKGDTNKMTNAVDHMLRREQIGAEKQHRAPDYQSKVMVAELFGLLIAGHDTTSTTLCWAVKFLAADQAVQSKLRSTLQSLYPAARSENRFPSAQEIATTPSNYLDACIEEIIRCGGTAGVLTRTTTTDVIILGHAIPKGTRIVMMSHGGGVMEPPFKIDDKLRNETYLKSDSRRTGDWDTENIQEFNPERWIVNGEFDASAGPHIMFGAGPRGCFGRKLAYLELRLAIVLIIWTFELQDVPEKYAGWEAIDQLTHGPIDCYVRLAKA